nr:hypothetical protein [Hephaestia sp. MAHUQ-44]
MALLGAATPALAQHKEISPYIEISQVLTDNFTTGDVLTYSQVAAGVDAAITTHNATAQVNYRYEHSFSWDKHTSDSDVHQGLARAAVGVGQALTIEGGALATRARSDIRGAATGFDGPQVDNMTQVYAFYVGPRVATRAGPVDLTASYRLGYVKVDAPGFTGLGPDVPRLDAYDDSTSHSVLVSAGVRPGAVAPVGVTVSAGYEREDAGQLDQRYEDKYVRGDVLVPVSATVALTAGVGYEELQTSQKDALLDADGNPVIDGKGRFVTDPASPQRIAYRTDGIYWDAGVVWRPSPRTAFEAHVGRRYDSWVYFGSLSHAMSETSGLRVVVYDQVDTFGRQLRNGIAGLPTSFTTLRDQFSGAYTGCTFGTSGSEVGGCLNDVFQSISTASYRARGVDGVIYASKGPLRMGFGAGYAHRKLYAPNTPTGAVTYGINDQSVYGQFFVQRALDANSSIEGNVFANWFDPGFVGAENIISTGTVGTYYRTFGRLGATASLGLYTFDTKSTEAEVTGQALVGLRYQF